MVRSIWSAATGMNAQQINMDNIANNLANVNNDGFRKGRVLFHDLLYQDLKPVGSITATGIISPTGIQVGMGSAVTAIEKIHTQGNYKYTYNAMDMMIEGDGFFQITMPDGTTSYTRSGAFRIDANGDVTTPEGYLLTPNINVPEGSRDLSVSTDGIFSVYLPGDKNETELGQIEIARFINPAGLKSISENLFLETGASGAVNTSIPGIDNFGKIRQHALETSNVLMVDEMVNMITGQRAYEMNSKAIQTSDEMLQTIAALKR